MNKYTAAGLIAAAETGKHIIVASHKRPAARSAFRDIADQAPITSITHAANGRERLTFPNGGEVRITVYNTHAHDTLQGCSADIVYLDWPVDVESPDAMAEAARCVAASACGEVIRA